MQKQVMTVLCLLGVVLPVQAATLTIDGDLQEPEWEQAQRFEDFRVTYPFTLALPALRTQARLLATPEGIAVAFINTQPPSVPRLKPRLERDQSRPTDLNNVIIDFDGDGKVAYGFAVSASGSIQDFVVTNELKFNYDWNGDWTSAVQETPEGWTVELLIPWSITAMRGGAAQSREIRVQFDRVLGATRERQATPGASTERGRFVSDFTPVQVRQYRASALQFFPYATFQQDFVEDRHKVKAGADVFWKPSAGFQLSAAINPDFGQVEADELVINFDAIETLFTDRRPFFTENQGFFDLRTPDDGQLIYTRRIGGPSDDRSGKAADIDAAVKLNGSLGRTGYGLLLADEADAAGRSFRAARLLHGVSDRMSIGWLGTDTSRPALDRDAWVQAADFNARPNERIRIDAQLLASQLEQQGRQVSGDGAWARLAWSPDPQWQYEAEATHLGRDFDFNDLGYQRRKSLNQLQLFVEHGHRVANEKSALRGTRWRGRVQARTNDQGDRLPGILTLTQINQFRSGALLQLEAAWDTSGVDDLISRGNGHWQRPARQRFLGIHRTPVIGTWQLRSELHVLDVGLGGHAVGEKFILDWLPRDDFSLQLRAEPLQPGEWLVWNSGRELSLYQRRMHIYGVDANWFPGRRHELRLKTQWIAVDARHGEQYRLNESGRIAGTGQTSPNFAVNSFGLQLRYRYELAPQSELYLVYSRGGQVRTEDDAQDSSELLGEALELRQTDQFLAKLRYRF